MNFFIVSSNSWAQNSLSLISSNLTKLSKSFATFFLRAGLLAVPSCKTLYSCILFAGTRGRSDKVSIVISQLTNFSEFIDAFGIVLLFVYKLISVHDELCYGCQLTKKFRCWQHKQCDYLTKKITWEAVNIMVEYNKHSLMKGLVSSFLSQSIFRC